ncbi:MAG: hypothetical protein HUJ75_03660, partial [Parasporobacterium sp.]|nr:hypothetical protein [Parasporobacterium sp.]
MSDYKVPSVTEESAQSIAKINAPVASETPEELFNKLVDVIKKYHPSADISMIEKAYEVAAKAHEGQKRHSG